MRSAPNVVGVVIARAGSQGVPGKNMARIGTLPLLARAILSARKARTLTRVILSTESPAFARVGQRYGAEVPFLRPARLARDKSHTPEVVEHAVRFLENRGSRVDVVVTLQPTSPFRTGKHIDAAVWALLKNSRLDSLISVKEAVFPPFWMFKLRPQILAPFVKDGVDYSLKERQQLPRLYQPNGAVYVTRRSLLRERGLLFSAFAGGRTGYSVMDALASIDIDHPVDLLVARRAARDNPRLLEF